MIRIDSIWLATQPMDMRAGTDTALARVVSVFGGEAALRLPFCQSPGQPHEGAGTRRRRYLAGGAPLTKASFIGWASIAGRRSN